MAGRYKLKIKDFPPAVFFIFFTLVFVFKHKYTNTQIQKGWGVIAKLAAIGRFISPLNQ